MTKPILPFVETMITQVCNLSCVGCTNYSDLQHKGYVPWSDGRLQLESWLERISMPDFGIMGGEPLINPEVSNWIYGIRELMPDTQIRFTTNGILLDKTFDVVYQLAEVGNSIFKISVHEQTVELEAIIEYIFNMFAWEPVTEFGITRYRTKNNFRFQINRPTQFLKTYRNDYYNMLPYDNNSKDAFNICCQQLCPLMHDGRIYKCSTSGLLAETLERFNNPNSSQWEQYLQTGIGPDCTDIELTEFLENFGKPAKVCSMCPTSADLKSKIIHLENVTRKKIK